MLTDILLAVLGGIALWFTVYDWAVVGLTLFYAWVVNHNISVYRKLKD